VVTRFGVQSNCGKGTCTDSHLGTKPNERREPARNPLRAQGNEMTQLTDQQLKCCDCSNPFIFSVQDQEFFAQNDPPWSPPRRCRPCRDSNKIRREGGQRNQQGGIRPQTQGAGQGSTPIPRRGPVQSVEAPQVQYRSRGVAESFARNYGPPAPARSAASTPERGKKEERRVDAYSERQARKSQSKWSSED